MVSVTSIIKQGPHLQPVPEAARFADRYRQIFTSLQLPPTLHHLVIGVTSAIGGEGRTSVACGLASTLGEDLEVPVTLIDMDVDRPSVGARFNLPPGPGMCEVLLSNGSLADVSQAVTENLSVVTAGFVGANGARMLRRLALSNAFHEIQEDSGVIVLDLPAVLTNGYTVQAASAANALILVVRAGITPLADVNAAKEQLKDLPLQGVVFNGYRSTRPRWWPGFST